MQVKVDAGALLTACLRTPARRMSLPSLQGAHMDPQAKDFVPGGGFCVGVAPFGVTVW